MDEKIFSEFVFFLELYKNKLTDKNYPYLEEMTYEQCWKELPKLLESLKETDDFVEKKEPQFVNDLQYLIDNRGGPSVFLSYRSLKSKLTRLNEYGIENWEKKEKEYKREQYLEQFNTQIPIPRAPKKS